VALAVSSEDPQALAHYAQTVRELAPLAKLTPLLFPGAPIAHEQDGALSKKLSLHGGYLYTHDPRKARDWHRKLRLENVSEAPELWLRRGDTVHKLTRAAKVYRHSGGPLDGERAKLLLFDQLAATRETLPQPAAFDLDAARPWLGVRQYTVEKLTAREVTGTARLANGKAVSFVAAHDGAQTRVWVWSDSSEALQAAIAESRALLGAQLAILEAADAMVAEDLRFDEPKTEFGQQDGLLRQEWWRAYRQGRDQYEVNGDTYPVFGPGGHAAVPQVCIDFVVDAIDRAGGSWFGRRGEPRRRSTGRIELRAWPNYRSRSVADTARLARENPQMWEIYTVPEPERAPFRETQRFRQGIGRLGEIQPADIFVIYGLRKDGRNHYHAYLVHRVDPLLGLPVDFVDNAGTARVRVMDDIMKAAPRRYILHKMRLKPDWLVARLSAPVGAGGADEAVQDVPPEMVPHLRSNSSPQSGPSGH
jgi:hypothetical protein